LLLFEEFMKASVIYYKRFAQWQKLNKTRIKMFLSTDDGYFQSLGSRSKRSLESVFLPKKQKTDILKCIDKFIKPETISEYKRLGVNHKLTLLLEGVPGTGKSSLITALASHYDFDIAIISFTPKMTDTAFLHILRTWERRIDNENNNNGDDNDGESRRHTILVIEDMDCIFKERKSNDEVRNSVTFSGILNGLDGITTSEHQIVIMTTNHIEHLDPALIRPGRVDYIMKFEHAVKEQIIEMFTVYGGKSYKEAGEIQAGEIQASEFYKRVKNLNIPITTSLLQQYLLKYMLSEASTVKAEHVEAAEHPFLSHVDDLKRMYEACTKQKVGELYS
jgi:chaperone BCS1